MSDMASGNDYTSGLMMKTIFKSLLLAYLITIPIFLVFAGILTYTDFPEKYINSIVLVVTIFSIFCSGFISSMKLRKRGWFSGALAGLGYMFILYVLSSLVFQDFGTNKNTFIMIIIGFLSGAIGGIIGVNSSSDKKHVSNKIKKYIPSKRQYKIKK